MPLCRRAVVLALLALAPAAPAAADAPGRSEQPLPPAAAGFDDVARSVVRIDAPLPATIDAPQACDRLSYVRYRDRSGPQRPQRAEAVVVAMPGTLAGAGSLALQASKVVQDAASAGHHIEYWTLDRRSNCLEDHTGLEYAQRTGDVTAALDYYYRDRVLDGRRFAGFIPSGRLGFLADFGVARTLEDWRTVLLEELPDAGFRRSRVFCGGHSLGGALAGMLMAWDFDGDPATRADAGYHLCAGTIAQDSSVDVDRLFGTPEQAAADPVTDAFADLIREVSYGAAVGLIRANVIPRDADLGIIGPEVETLLEGIGIQAHQRPQEDTAALTALVPRESSAEVALRFFHARTLGDVVAPTALLRRQHLTSQALLGAFMDDNSQPFGFVQASVGSFDRGPVVPKSFPWPSPPLLMPDSESVRYGWRRFDEPPADLRRPDGTPYSTPASEVTDIDQLARILPDAPLDFLEHYYPTRLTIDALFAGLGSRSGDLRHLRYRTAPDLKPRLTLTALEGLGPDPAPAVDGVPSVQVELPGYNHVDAITAAPVQNDGTRERGAAAEAAFVLEHAGRRWDAVPPAASGRRSDAAVAASLRRAVR